MKRFSLLLLFSCSLFADQVVLSQLDSGVSNPWHTGPLLTPSGAVVPGGHANIEPFIIVKANTGLYDASGNVIKTDTFWQYTLLPVIQIGLNSWMDIQLLPALTRNSFKGQSGLVFEDLPVALDFRILAPSHINSKIPFVLFSVYETFPTGKYRNLNPNRRGTDIGGTGSFRTAPAVTIQQFFHIQGPNFLIARAFFQYEFPAPVHVKGLSSFGGGRGTNARVFPGQNFLTTVGLELTLTKRWVLACDFTGRWRKKTRVSGKAGKNEEGEEALLGFPFSRRFTIAPAVEYNFSENLGIIGGSWFSVAGRNAVRFWSAVFAVNYYI